MRLSKREVILILILTLAVFAYSFFRFLYQPLLVKAEVLRQENYKLTSQLNLAGQMKKKNTSLVLEREKIKADYQLLAAQLPAEPSLPEIIVFLEEAAGQAGVKLQFIGNKMSKEQESLSSGDASAANSPASANNSGEADKKGGEQKPKNITVQILNLEVKAEGDYLSILDFMDKVENAPRIYISEQAKLWSQAKESAVSSQEGEQVQVRQEEQPSARYDGSKISLSLFIQAGYDQKSLEGIKGREKEVAAGDGRENPFRP